LVLILQNYDFVELSEEEYKAFNEKVNRGSFLQTSYMANLLLDIGWDICYVGVKSTELKLAAVLASKTMTGGRHFEMQYGPVFVDGDAEVQDYFYQEVQKFVKSKGALELLLIPNEDYQRFNDQGEPISEPNENFLSLMAAKGYSHRSFESGYNERGESTWHYVKDLSQIADQKALLKSYSKSGQYSVKKTKQFGISVRPMKKEELPIFRNMTELTSSRLGYDDHDLAYYEHFYDAFEDKVEFLLAEMNFASYAEDMKQSVDKNQKQIEKLEAEIAETDSAKKKKQRDELKRQTEAFEKRLAEVSEFSAEYGDKMVPLAAALTVYGSSETVYLASGSYEEFKNFYAPFAIQHYAMSKSVEMNIPSYNFFGIQGVFDGSDGVMRFKENFAGYAVEKVGYFTYFPNLMKKKALTVMKKIIRR